MMIVNSIRFIFKLILWVILALLIIFFVVYAIAPVYNFAEPKPFSGPNIHNPYENMDSTAWKKGNFHAQSRAWLGITDGRKNTPEAIQTIYEQLGYDIIVITDYMRINRFNSDAESYIPAYEHGYGFWKTHQICLGASRVTWLDYPFFQTLNHKQHILNRLSRHNELVFIAHPRVREGYRLADMPYLTNYPVIEAVSHYEISLDYWDLALSSGQPVFIVANDDTHDVFNLTKVGRFCTFVNSKSLNGSDIAGALRSGNAYGARINMLEGTDLLKRAEDHRNVPTVKAVEVHSDTLYVEVSRTASVINFIGQGGIIKKTAPDTRAAFYPISGDDSYIRTEIIFKDNTQLYLNPVFRYSGERPEPPAQPTINHLKTWLQRVVALIVAVIMILIVRKLKSPKQKRGFINRRQYYWE